jgi:uncharacterized protein YbcI
MMDERLGTPSDPAEERRIAGSVAAQVSREMVKLMSRYTGRGPTKARATVNTNLVVVVFEDTLTRGELNLVAAGLGESVIQMRRGFQSLMRDEAIATVEALTGRRVMALLSDVAPSENVAAEVFVLDRRPDTGIAITAEAESGTEEPEST